MTIWIGGIKNVVRVIGVPVRLLVGISGLYKMMMLSSSDDNVKKVVGGGAEADADADTGRLSQRLKTRLDVDQFIA